MQERLRRMTFRGKHTLALMCRSTTCDDEAELLVANDEFPERSYSEWCVKHYLERVVLKPREHASDCVYKLVRIPKGTDMAGKKKNEPKKTESRDDFTTEVDEIIELVDELGATDKMKRTEYIVFLKELIGRLESQRDISEEEDERDKDLGVGEYKT